MDLPPFMAPVMVDNELDYYAYTVLKLELASEAGKPLILDKVPYIQDALLRSVHQEPFGRIDTGTPEERSAALARLQAVIDPIVGAGVVTHVDFRTLTKAAH